MNVNFKKFIEDLLSYNGACMEVKAVNKELEDAIEALSYEEYQEKISDPDSNTAKARRNIMEKEKQYEAKSDVLKRLKRDVRNEQGFQYFSVMEEMAEIYNNGICVCPITSFLNAVENSPEKERIHGLFIDIDKLAERDNLKRIINEMKDISYLMDYQVDEGDQKTLRLLLKLFGKNELFTEEMESEKEREEI